MITLIKNLDKRSLAVELPAFATAMMMAEFLFTFHSFTLECSAFLATWTVLSYGLSKFKNVI